jgi:hypothetical protein
MVENLLALAEGMLVGCFHESMPQFPPYVVETLRARTRSAQSATGSALTCQNCNATNVCGMRDGLDQGLPVRLVAHVARPTDSIAAVGERPVLAECCPPTICGSVNGHASKAACRVRHERSFKLPGYDEVGAGLVGHSLSKLVDVRHALVR